MILRTWSSQEAHDVRNIVITIAFGGILKLQRAWPSVHSSMAGYSGRELGPSPRWSSPTTLPGCSLPTLPCVQHLPRAVVFTTTTPSPMRQVDRQVPGRNLGGTPKTLMGESQMKGPLTKVE